MGRLLCPFIVLLIQTEPHRRAHNLRNLVLAQLHGPVVRLACLASLPSTARSSLSLEALPCLVIPFSMICWSVLPIIETSDNFGTLHHRTDGSRNDRNIDLESCCLAVRDLKKGCDLGDTPRQCPSRVDPHLAAINVDHSKLKLSEAAATK